MVSMERAIPESIPRIKLDNDEVNNLMGQMRVPSVSTPKRFGGGTTIHQQALHPQVGKQLHGENLHDGVSDYLKKKRTQGVSPTGNGDSLVCDGECTQDTKPARNVAFPHTLFSSRSVP